MESVNKHRGHSLPHWDRPGWPNFVTFRLADAMPLKLVADWKDEVERTIALKEITEQRTLGPHERRMIQRKLVGSVEKYMDLGHGCCALKDPAAANIVQEALLNFDGSRYRLLCWCVMPNHVHAIVETMEGSPIETVVAGWKSYSSRQINACLGRKGKLWQAEYFDHLIRNGKDLDRFSTYILENPEKANLRAWKWRGVFDLQERIKAMDENPLVIRG